MTSDDGSCDLGKEGTNSFQISIPPDIAAFVRNEVARGAHTSESEMIASALRFYLKNAPPPRIQGGGIFA